MSPLPEATLIRFAEILGEKAEVIASYSPQKAGSNTTDIRSSLLNMLSRRPCTLDDMAAGLGLHPNEIIKHLDLLLTEKQVETSNVEGRIFYHRQKESGF